MLKNIPEIVQRIKYVVLGELFVVLLVVFVGLLSFGLGRLSVEEGNRVPVQILNTVNSDTIQQAASPTGTNSMQEGSQFVGSKNGTKYHFPWCSGAQRIKEENKIWFASKAEAEAAGYTPAANCRGL